MPVIPYVRVSTPHLQRHPHSKPTRTHRWGYHHPDYRRLLPWSPSTEHGACTLASGSLTGEYGRGGWSVCRRVSAPRPLSTDQHQGTCHGHFAWAADEGGLPRHRGLESGVLTPHQLHAYPLSGRVQRGHHRLSADGVHRHSQPLRPLAEALTPCFPQRVGVKPPPEDTCVNPVRRRQVARCELLGPRRLAPDGLGKGMRGARLDRPTLERQCQGAPRGGFTTGVGVSPTPLARHAVPPRWWLEAVDPPQTPPLWLADPGGVTPSSQWLTPRHGRRAAAARPHRLERTRRRRLAPGRRDGGTARTPRPSSADRCQGPAPTLAPRVQKEERH
jgi:hypothetical protein